MSPGQFESAAASVPESESAWQTPIGIVIPTFNRSDVLIECLLHLEAQTWTDFEVIVVDDGSTDATPDLLLQYAGGTPLRLRCIRQANAGPAAARNLAVAMLRSPVCILIGDDILVSPRFVEEHLALHQQHPQLQTVAVGFTRWSENRQRVTPFMRWLDQDGVQFAYKDLLAGEPPGWRHFYTSNLSLKTEQLRRFPFDRRFRGAGAEDIELGSRMSDEGELAMYFLPNAEAEHVHPTDVTKSCLRLISVGDASYTLATLRPDHAVLMASTWKERVRNVLMEPRVTLPALRTVASLITRYWCPNPLLKRVLTLHFKYGYQRARARSHATGH